MLNVDSSRYDEYLRKDRIPHIWCPGCGLGIVLGSFIDALEASGLDRDKVAVVSGIGCTGRIAGYLNLDSFHTTHGRAIPFATGLKLANPEMKVVVISGDGDLFAIGGNHFIHAARRNINISVICTDNFIYGMTGGQCGPTTPVKARSTTTPYGNYEAPFNLVDLAAACGAPYVARWTVYHVRPLRKAMGEVLSRRGFNFLEVISPCPTSFERRNKLGTSLERMRYYKDNSVVKNGADPSEASIGLGGKILCGRFVSEDKPTFLDIAAEATAHIRGGDK